MAKKYKNEDLKSLKRDEIINLLKKENVEFDEQKQSLFALRGLLLNIDVEDESAPDYAEMKAEVNEETEEMEQSEPEQAVEEKPEQAVDEVVANSAFKNELSKRMAEFGRAELTVFDIELARRQGKVTGKISFEEELKIRQNKVRR